jgi:glycosyltransferase involved in cell wall biosynthesis
MRLGFHYHIPAEQRSDGIWMPGYLGCFVDGLAAQCEHLVCFQHSPRPSEHTEMDYRVDSGNVELIDIGRHVSVPRRVMGSRRFTIALEKRRRDLDCLLVRGPSPLLPAFVRAAGDLPTALLLVGSYVDGVEGLPQPRWRKELIRWWFHYNKWGQDRAVRRSLTFVNSRKLFEEMENWAPSLVETRTTTLNQGDFFFREDTCLNRPIRLLYAGRLDPAKGLDEIVETLAELVRDGRDLVLDLVGWADAGSRIVEELRERAERGGVADRVLYHGRAALGPELFAYYRNADVYVIASRLSFEGFPRTIWEAMAHCVPVDLARALRRVLDDSERRRRMIAEGQLLARQNTLDVRCREMVDAIREWVGGGS